MAHLLAGRRGKDLKLLQKDLVIVCGENTHMQREHRVPGKATGTVVLSWRNVLVGTPVGESIRAHIPIINHEAAPFHLLGCTNIP